MKLTKQSQYDKVEVVGEFKAVQCREKTTIFEDGVEISSSYHRHVLHPDSDITNEPEEVQNICNVVWTDKVKSAWTNELAERREGVPA
jgi:hypothetical protein